MALLCVYTYLVDVDILSVTASLLRIVCAKKISKSKLTHPSAPTGDAFTIQAVHSNKYLNVFEASFDNGADVLL